MKLLSTVLLLISLWVSPSYAQNPCALEAVMLKHLQDNFGEIVIAEGRDVDNEKITITASSNGKTWTALLTNNLGISCIVSAGTDWLVVPINNKNTI